MSLTSYLCLQMEIPASSLINRYIACQGPLPNTCPDFWQMSWEQGSSMVVMLTTQVERGRVRRREGVGLVWSWGREAQLKGPGP